MALQGGFIGDSAAEWLHSEEFKLAFVGGYSLSQVPGAGTPRFDVLTPPTGDASARNSQISATGVIPRPCDFGHLLLSAIALTLYCYWLCSSGRTAWCSKNCEHCFGAYEQVASTLEIMLPAAGRLSY